MKKGIFTHVIGTFIYLGCFLYVTDGIDINYLVKLGNVIMLGIVNLSIAAYCNLNDVYKKK
jgi:nicotinamide riboside transporter PnuC